MQIVLKINSGTLAGRKAWLTNGQSVRVGRTLDADFAVPDDPKLSGIHFLLRCDESRCVIRDLGSRNGTFVNGKKTDEFQLSNGDLVYAGTTTFHVEIEKELVDSNLILPSLRPAAKPVEAESRHDDAEGVQDSEKEVASSSISPGIERVVLFRTGVSTVSKVWLLPGQELTVGRNETADLAVPEDLALSGRHFVVECFPDKCVLRDLGSRNGTMLNGETVTEAELHDGDKIVASTTTFTVDIDGGTEADATEPSESRHVPGYTCVRQNELVTAFQGVVPGQLMEVVDLISKYRPLYLVIDPEKRDAFESTRISRSRFLLNWLDDEIIPEVSPVVLALTDESKLLPAIELSWAHDTTVCLFSKLDQHELTEQLRRMVRQPVEQSWSGAGVMACFWPSILSVVLTAGDQPFTEQLFAAVDAVLIESNAPGGWTLFAPDSFGKALKRLGFEEVEAA